MASEKIVHVTAPGKLEVVLAHRWCSPSNPEVPLGLAYLASYARRYGGYDRICLISDHENIAERILERTPAIVGFYAYTAHVEAVVALAGRIRRERPGTVLLLGGPHPSVSPQELPQPFDIGVVGEGEETFLELLRLAGQGRINDPTALASVAGIAYRHEHNVAVTPRRAAIADIDTIPFPARDLFANDLLERAGSAGDSSTPTTYDIFTLRGCPYQCVYCQQHAFGRAIRMHSARYVVKEIEHLHTTYNARSISFSDDLFTIKKSRMREIIELLEQKHLLGTIRFRADVRANLVDDEMVSLLKQLGVAEVSIGVETASERLLSKLKGGGVTVEKTWNAIKKINAAGIGVFACIMIGAPDETWEEMQMTRRFLAKLLKNHPDNFYNFTPMTPLPGTQLYEECVDEGLITPPLPLDGLDFEFTSFNRRPFHICRNVSQEKMYRFLWSLHRMRRLHQMKALFKKDPAGFLAESARTVFRLAGRKLGRR